MLMLHIIIGIATLISAIGSVALMNKRFIHATPYLLGGTIASGALLIVVNPAVSILHLCISGLLLSAVTVILHRIALRRTALETSKL